MRRLQDLAEQLAALLHVREPHCADGSARKQTARMPLGGGYVLSRSVLDAALVDAAVEAGVEFRDGVTATPGDAPLTIVAAGLWLDTTDTPLAKKLTSDEEATAASFAIMSLGKTDFAAWNWRRTLPVEFHEKGKKIKSFEAAGERFERK